MEWWRSQRGGYRCRKKSKIAREREAFDKIEALASEVPNVVNDEVYVVRFAADKPIESAGPDLGVCGEFECLSTDGEEERLEVGILRKGNAEELRTWIEDRASRSAIAVKGFYVGVVTLYSYLVTN